MAQRVIEIFRLRLFVFAMAAISLFLTASAKAENQPSSKELQPQAMECTGLYALKQIDPNLTGFGVKFALLCRSITYIDGMPQNDYQPNTEHNCFRDRQLTFMDQGDLPAGISPHATAICSILFGEDPNAFDPQLGQFHYQGTTPEAKADIYEFWHFLINNVFHNSPPDADILTASIGNHFEDWWTRGIQSLAEHHGLIVVAGIGNGSDVYDPPLYPGAGANVIGVGVVDPVNTENLATELANFSLAYPDHSSFGPTTEGRCKPDIVAPGNLLAADANDPDLYEPTGSWSSFATPLVAGTIGLLVQKAKEDPNLSPALSPEGGNCVIKAILMNSATKLPYWHKGLLTKEDDHFAPLDYIQGAGMLNATDAYKHLIAGPNNPDQQNGSSTIGWDLNRLQEKLTQENIYPLILKSPAGHLITATLVWNKHYDSVYPFEPNPEMDADLRLELWAIDPNNPKNDYLLDYSDSRVDNVEHIYALADPNFTNYEIVVSYSNSEETDQTPPPIQRYGLAWNASLKQNKDNIGWYDLNADGVVNKSDIAVWIANYSESYKSPKSNLIGDIDADGEFDMDDLQLLTNHLNDHAEWYD